MFLKPTIRENKIAVDQVSGQLSVFASEIQQMHECMVPDSDANLRRLCGISEQLIPQINFNQLEIIPNFDRLLNVIQLILVAPEPRIESIVAVNIISSLFNAQLNSGSKFQPYYAMRLFSVAASGLHLQQLSLKSAFLMFFSEILEAIDSNTQLQSLTGAALGSVVYGLLSTSETSFKPVQATNKLFDISQFQTEQFISVTKEWPVFLELLEVQFGHSLIFSKTIEQFFNFSSESVFLVNLAKYLPGLLSRADPTEIEQEIVTAAIECVRVCAKRTLNAAEFDALCVIYSELLHQQAEVDEVASFSIIILMLKHQHQFTLKSFTTLLKTLYPYLEHFIVENDLQEEIMSVLDKTDFGLYIFEQETMKELLLDTITKAIYENLALYSLDSKNYAENTEEYQAHIQKIHTCVFTIQNLKKFEENYLSYLVEKINGYYKVQKKSQTYADIEVIFELFKQLLKTFQLSFFSEDFIRFAMSTTDAPEDEQLISGKLVFLICFRGYISKCVEISYLKFLLDIEKQNIFTLINLLQFNLKRNQSDSSNLCCVLGILRILLEASKQFVNYDFFTNNQDIFQELVENVLLSNINQLDDDEIIETKTFFPDESTDLQRSMLNETFFQQNLEDIYSITKADLTGRLNKNSQVQYFSLKHECFVLFSYVIQVYKSYKDLTPDIQQIYLVLKHLKSFSETLSTAATVLFANYSLNKSTLDNLIKKYFYQGDNLFDKHQCIQVLSYQIPQISLVQRMLSQKYSQESLISITPLTPIVKKETVNYMQVLARNITEFILPTNEDQVKGVDFMQQELQRYTELMYKDCDKNIEVRNLMINPIYSQLADLIIMMPLLNFVLQPEYKNKQLQTACTLIIDNLFALEPELVVNSVLDYIDFFSSSAIKRSMLSQLTMTNVSSMNQNQEELHKQKFITKLLKLPVQQFAFQYQTVGSTVVEYTYQKMKQYFTSSQYSSITINVLTSLLDLSQFSLQNINQKYYDVLFTVTEFSEKQIQHSPRNFGQLVVSRLKLFQDLNIFSPLLPRVYDFFLKALRVFIDFDQIFQISGEQYFTEFVSYEQLVEFFTMGVELVQNNVQKTAQILNLLIQNLRKQNEILLKIFLTVLNNYYRDLLPLQKEQKIGSLFQYLANAEHLEMYMLFLTQLLFVETTYTQEFPQLIQILDAEMASNGVELLFNICSAIQGYKITPEFINIEFDQNSGDKLFRAVSKPFYDDFLGHIIQDTKVYQKSFVSLINRWNQMHITSRDVASVFNLALDKSNLVLIHILVKYRIYEIDLSYKDKILELFARIQIKDLDNCLQNVIYVKFLQELCRQVSRIHDIIIRQYSELILTIITNIVAACLANDPSLKYLSKKQQYFTEVYSYQIELFGEITQSIESSKQLDQTELKYLYDFRLSELVSDYIRMISAEISKHTDTSFLRRLMQSLIILIMKSQQIQNDTVGKDATVLTIFDMINQTSYYLIQHDQQLSTEDLLEVEELTGSSFLEFCFKIINQTIKDSTQCALGRRTLLFVLMLDETEGCPDVTSYFSSFFKQYSLTEVEMDQALEDSRIAYQVYQKLKDLTEKAILPIFSRGILLQQSQQNIPALKPIIDFIRVQAGKILAREYQLNVSAGYYEAKLPASQINNCRTMILPFFVAYILQKKLNKQAEIEAFDHQFEKVWITWQLDMSAKSSGWLKVIENIDNTVQGGEWCQLIQKIASELLE
ncbi:Hypothetical_protein [Hexamita inflata]|uniref:Hypothetical_protein n=1 Tax=Hexamita inflata TaxID=28002 RepID=A0AA86UW65_9EUKA|nr:Hypothetical protein HINF_LOCUS38763 [Hexamita inflata]